MTRFRTEKGLEKYLEKNSVKYGSNNNPSNSKPVEFLKSAYLNGAKKRRSFIQFRYHETDNLEAFLELNEKQRKYFFKLGVSLRDICLYKDILQSLTFDSAKNIPDEIKSHLSRRNAKKILKILSVPLNERRGDLFTIYRHVYYELSDLEYSEDLVKAAYEYRNENDSLYNTSFIPLFEAFKKSREEEIPLEWVLAESPIH